jgi:hypothetical protein
LPPASPTPPGLVSLDVWSSRGRISGELIRSRVLGSLVAPLAVRPFESGTNVTAGVAAADH